MLALWFIGAVVTDVLFFMLYCHLVKKFDLYQAWLTIGEQGYTVTWIVLWLFIGLPLDFWLGLNRKWPTSFILYESILGSLLVYADVVMVLRYADMDEDKRVKIRLIAATIVSVLVTGARIKLGIIPNYVN